MDLLDVVVALIALGALIVSILALVRSTPVPRWVAENALEKDDEGVWHHLKVTNRGSGAAGDVELRSLYTGQVIAPG